MESKFKKILLGSALSQGEYCHLILEKGNLIMGTKTL